MALMGKGKSSKGPLHSAKGTSFKGPSPGAKGFQKPAWTPPAPPGSKGSGGRTAGKPSVQKGSQHTGKSAAKPVPTSAPDGTDVNKPKTKLNTFLQRFCQRPITKDDSLYSVEEDDGQFRAVLTLPCIEGSPEFIGDLCSTPKEAEQLAAEQALDAFADEIAALPPTGTKPKKQSTDAKENAFLKAVANSTATAATAVGKGKPSPGTNSGKASAFASKGAYDQSPGVAMTSKGKGSAVSAESKPLSDVNTPKTKLNTFLQRFCKRPILKEDVDYAVEKHDGEVIVVLTLPCVEGSPEFRSELCNTVKEAECSAAQQALDEFADEVAAVTPSKPKKQGTGAQANAPGDFAAKAFGKGKPDPSSYLGKAPSAKAMMMYAAAQSAYDQYAAAKGTYGQYKGAYDQYAFAKGAYGQYAAAKGPYDQSTWPAKGLSSKGKAVIAKGFQKPAQQTSKTSAQPEGKVYGGELVDQNPKGALNTFLQRLCQRPIAKDECLYSLEDHGGKWQAILTLSCIDGSPEFISDLADTQKDAEKLAAKMALDAYADDMAALPPSAGQLKKHKGGQPIGSASMPVSVSAVGKDIQTPKTELNTFLQRFCQRPVSKGDSLYVTERKDDGKFEAVLTLPCIDGCPEFRGELGMTAKEAEQLAAQQALAAFADEMDNLPPSATKLKQEARREAKRALDEDENASEPAVKRHCTGD